MDINTVEDRSSILSYWRENFGEHTMRRFDILQTAMLEAEAALKKVLGPRASLRAYARLRALEWLRSATHTSIDPDLCIIRTRYRYKLGNREVIQEDRRSLTDYAIFGQQDKDRITLSFEGQTSSAISYFSLENWLSQVDIRSDYAQMLINEPSQAVHDASQEYLARQMEFTAFCDRFERPDNAISEDWLKRLLQGDPSMLVRGVVLQGTGAPLRNLFLISERSQPEGQGVYFTPGDPDGGVWHRVANSDEARAHIHNLTVRHPDFLSQQVGSRYQLSFGHFLRELSRNVRAWTLESVRFVDVAQSLREPPLAGVVSGQVRWDRFESIELAPPNYRTASFDERQEFASLNTQLKALYTVEGREAALVSYEKFAYSLIKERVEGVLKERGEVVTVNPDLINIEFGPQEKMSLTSVITREKAFYAVENDRLPVDSYPRFRVGADHPSINKLNILDLAGWSRTLRPGEKYIEMLHSVYLNPGDPAYTFRRDVHFERQQAEMNRAALSSYFQGRISREVFHDFKQAIASLRTPDINGAPVIGDVPVNQNSVYQFHLGRRRPVEGVYVFRFMKGREVKDYLYTPQAPDGIWFRPLENFDTSVRINDLRQYYIDRVHYLNRTFAGEYFDALLASKSTVKAPDLEVGSRVRNFSGAYEQMIRRVIDDVDAVTTSLAEIIAKVTYDTVMLAAQVLSLAIPPVGLAVSAVQITKNVIEGIEAYHYRDRAKAADRVKTALIELATLGYGKYKELGKPAVSSLQKTLIDLAGDAKTLADLVSKAAGLKVPHEVLLEIVQDTLKTESHSKAWVR